MYRRLAAIAVVVVVLAALPIYLESFWPVSYTHLTLPTNREV